MAVLEKVMQMRKMGMPDTQIAQSLKQEGISPKEIIEAISQSKIKYAINEEPNISMNEPSIPPELPAPEIQPSQPAFNETQEYEQYPSSSSFYPQQSYPYQEYPEYQPQQTDIATITDIAEQIIEEKNEKLREQISAFAKFKEDIAFSIENISKRLERIENSFNALQAALLGKIGEYSQNMKDITKELKTTQDSFSKIVNPLTDNIRELQKITGKNSSFPKEPELETAEEQLQETKEKPRQKTSKRDGFENYLR